MDAMPQDHDRQAIVRAHREDLRRQRESRAIPVLTPEDVARAQSEGAAPVPPALDPETTAVLALGRAALRKALHDTARKISGGTPHVG